MKYIYQKYTVKSTYGSRQLQFACLADLHMRENTPPERLERLLPQLRRFKKLDGIFILGDLMDSADQATNPKVARRALKWLRSLSTIAPVFLIYGNHDIKKRSRHNTLKIPRAFRQKVAKIPHLTALENNTVETADFFVAGLELDQQYYRSDAQVLPISENKKFLEHSLDQFLVKKCTHMPNKPRIFLFHSPIYGALLQEKLKNFDIILTGHMHNGCMPKPFLSCSKNRGLISPYFTPLPRYAHSHTKNLFILSPVTTLPKTLHFANEIFPTYFTILKIN